MTRNILLFIGILFGKFGFSQLSFTVGSSSGGFSLSCNVPVFSMYASSNFSNNVNYLWTTPLQNTVGVNNIIVYDGPGIYTVTASSGTLSSTQTIAITSSTVAPTVSVSSGPIYALTCLTPTILMTGTFNPSNSILSWIEPGVGLGCNSTTCIAATSGTYAFVAKDPNNGCVSTATINITDNRIYPLVQAGDVFSVACPSGTVNLSPIITNSITTLAYQWTSPPGAITSGSSSSVLNTNSPGAYTVVVTNTVNGCGYRALIYVYACVGLTENRLTLIEVFPNPTKDIVKIKQLPFAVGGYSIQILNLFGQTILQRYLQDVSAEIDVKMLNSGLYFLSISGGESQRIIRLLKE